MKRGLFKAQPYRVDTPHGTFVIVYGRAGVQPTLASLLLFPVWLISRLLWEASPDRGWRVDMVLMRKSGLGGTRVRREVVPSQEAARAVALDWIHELEGGPRFWAEAAR